VLGVVNDRFLPAYTLDQFSGQGRGERKREREIGAQMDVLFESSLTIDPIPLQR